MKDILSILKSTSSLAPVQITGSTNTTGTDRQDGEALIFNINVTDTTLDVGNSLDVKLQESDDNIIFADVAVEDYILDIYEGITLPILTIESDGVKTLGYRGAKRFVRTNFEVNTGSPDGIFSVVGILGSLNRDK